MLKKLKQMLFDSSKSVVKGDPEADMRLAVASLLVEAAVMDGNFDAPERQTITHLLCDRFSLENSDATSLIEDAEAAVAKSIQLYGFTRVLKDTFTHDDRLQMVEMLWGVIYADGVAHDYETNLMRRICGLLHVPDRESGAARKRVLAKLEL